MQEKKIRTAVIGAGKMGAIHTKVYHQLQQSKLVAVIDVDAVRAKRLAKKHKCSYRCGNDSDTNYLPYGNSSDFY